MDKNYRFIVYSIFSPRTSDRDHPIRMTFDVFDIPYIDGFWDPPALPRYNPGMPGDFSVLIPIRYGDLDAQGHVNNARSVTFIEHARILYLRDVGLWDGRDFKNLGLIVADVHVAYLAQILYGQTVRVRARVTHLGNKSMKFEYLLEDAETGLLFSRAETVMVAFDYHADRSIPIPDSWREKIAAFEGIPRGGSGG